jgi:hypothetical protein
MRRFPVVNLGQFVEEFEGLPLDGDTLSRLCDAVLAWHGASSSSGGARTMRDAVADVRSILGPMNLTNRRAAEAQIRQACPRNPTPLFDQIPFAVPPTAEQTTTAQTPFYSPGPAKPPPPYKPVASVDRFIPADEEPAESLGPEGLTYPEPVMGPPGKPMPPPAPPPVASTDEALRRHLEWMRQAGISQEYAPVGTPATVSQPTAQPVTPPQQPRSTPTGMLPPTQRDVGSVDCSHLGPNAYFDGRQCRSADMRAAAGGFGNLMNIAAMAPAATAASGISLMGRRFPVVNL